MRLAIDLGSVGVWSAALGKVPATDARRAVAEIEELGYGTVWFPESVGSKEAFSQAGLLLSASNRLVIATGIANIWARDPMAMTTGAHTLGEAWPGRFVLGIGVSTDLSVPMRGHTYERPFSVLRDYVAAMGDVDYSPPAPAVPVPLMLGSIGPKSLAFASRIGWGVHTYFVPPEHTRFARDILGDNPLLAVEQAVLLESDPDRARETARAHTAYYLARSAYRTMLLRLGWTEDDLDGGGSDALVDAVVAWGGAETVSARVHEHLAAGASHVCLQPLGDSPDDIALDQLRTLAPRLL